MPPLYNFTRIGRTLSPFNRTHQIMAGIAVLVGIGHGLAALFTAGIGAGLLAGTAAGLSAVTAWVLTRELDPDGQRAALLSAALAGVIGGMLSYIPLLFVLVILLRVVNRTVGPPLRWTDTLAVIAIVVVTAVTHRWTFALVGGLALLLDGFLVNPLRRHLWGAALLFAALPFTFDAAFVRVGGFAVFVLVGLIVGYGWHIASLDTVYASSDDGGPLYLERVQAASLVVSLAALLAIITGGGEALTGYVPLWAAMAGTLTRRIIK